MDVVKRDHEKKYALFGINRNGVTIKREVEPNKLKKIVKTQKPDALALESVYEIGNRKEILEFAKNLPEKVGLVQIIEDPDEHKKLLKTAIRNNIKVKNYKEASEKARISALLVKNGIGKKIKLSQGTEIRIAENPESKNEQGEQNGISNLIEKKIEEIKEKLKDLNLNYDLETKNQNNSLKGIFKIYAPLKKVKPYIPEIKSNIKVEVHPKEKGNIKFTSLKTGENIETNIIVGIDPGMTSAIGILDMKGNFKHVESLKDYSVSDLVNLISDLGHPAIIATDVNPVPSKVEKISRMFDSKLFIPKESLSIQKKKDLIEELNVEIEDDHQMDALAAAKNAFNSYRPKFSNIEAKLSEELKEKSGEIKFMVLKGTTIEKSIKKAEKTTKKAGKSNSH